MFLIIPIHNHMQYDPDAESALHRREVVAAGCILTCVQMFVCGFLQGVLLCVSIRVVEALGFQGLGFIGFNV